MSLKCCLLSTIIIGLDNQATICSLNNQKHKPAHHLLDLIHTAAKHLHSCQDHIQQWSKIQNLRHVRQNPRIKSKDACDLHIHWVPGHHNFEPNEKAGELAQEAAKGESSLCADLPVSLWKLIPMSVAALCQEAKAKIQHIWARRWKISLCCIHMGSIDKYMPLKKWLSW